MSSVVSPATQCSTHDDTQQPSSLGLGNHNVQVFPVSSSPPVQTGEERAPLRATLLPGWWITSQARQHCPPVGQIVDSQMGKHPSSWSSSLYLCINSTQLEVEVKEIRL